MKTFLHYIFVFCESFGKARAATYFVRQGDYESARKVMAD